jgi:ferredoxin
MRIVIDEARCVGHGRCYDVAAPFFEPDEYGHGRAVGAEIPAGVDLGPLHLAVACCPEGAITLED